MSYYYVDPLAGGVNTGIPGGIDPSDPTDPINWVDAWVSLASAFTTAVAGDIVFCRGSQTLVGSMSTVRAGTAAAGRIIFIGCPLANAPIDGTPFTLDGNASVATGLVVGHDFIWFENFLVDDCTLDGIDPAFSSNECVYYNVHSNNNGRHGWTANGTNTWHFYCGAEGNGQNGWNLPSAYNLFIGCVAAYNTDSGFYTTQTHDHFIECISHDNGGGSSDSGFRTGARNLIFSCVVDNEYIGFNANGHSDFVMRSRITNNVIGGVFQAAGDVGGIGFCLFDGNSFPVVDSGVDNKVLRNHGESNTNAINPDADDGYNDQSNDDFNLKPGRFYNGDGSQKMPLGIGS